MTTNRPSLAVRGIVDAITGAPVPTITQRSYVDPGHYPRLIGARLRELRATRGLTATGVARLMGSHHSIVCRLENGHHTPGLESIARYAHACGYDVHDVLSCLKTPPSADAAPAKTDGLSGTSQPARSNPPGLAATGHLALDAPFGLADVREAAESFAQSIVAGSDVQTPGAVVGAASVCSDSRASGSVIRPPDATGAAVALPSAATRLAMADFLQAEGHIDADQAAELVMGERFSEYLRHLRGGESCS